MKGIIASQIIRYAVVLIFLIIALIGFDRSYNRKYYACIDYLESMRLQNSNQISNAGTCATQVK
ncbi:hypothetical protein B1219_06470 [Pseudomonas ogarae]|nr:hypothetical protein B1219_06470 [Pseudomonas ogarae]OPG78075.1 hypothetical protein B1218_17620 [Pseudomonas ogarae]